MTCRCGSARTLHVGGKCGDRSSAAVPHLNLTRHGYLPRLPGIGSGSYLALIVCLDCGTLQGFQPLSDEALAETFENP